jgi:nitrate/nitrite-specific signal transduction histidine kinase
MVGYSETIPGLVPTSRVLISGTSHCEESLEEMTARAKRITVNNLADRLVISNPDDELGHMARVLNHLLQRLEVAFHQLQRFTSDAAHELHTTNQRSTARP